MKRPTSDEIENLRSAIRTALDAGDFARVIALAGILLKEAPQGAPAPADPELGTYGDGSTWGEPAAKEGA